MSRIPRIPHGITYFGVGAATTSFVIQHQKNEAQKKNSETLQNELAEAKKLAEESRKDIAEIKKTQEKIIKTQETLSQKIDSVISSTQKLISNFDLSSIKDLYNKYIEFLNSFDILASTLIYNIICTSFLLSLAFSFFIGKYGNYLIDRFNIELKYPKLAKFLKIRMQLQRYYFTYLTFLAITTLLMNLIANTYGLYTVLS